MRESASPRDETQVPSNHTPGVWHVHKHDIGPYYGDIWSSLGRVDGLTHIRTIGVLLKYAPADQQEANGRLIAAAPDLLLLAQSLPVMLALAAKLHPDSPINWGQFEQDANDAIAKATQPSTPAGEANPNRPSESGA